MNKIEYYKQQAVPIGTFRYYSTLFADPSEKQLMHTLYALEDALQQPLQCTEPAVALNKWHWWREEIQRLFKGQSQHPITQALQHLPQWHNVPESSLLSAMDPIRSRIENPYSENETAFYQYCAAYHGATAQVFFHYGGWHDDAASHCARRLGSLLGIGHTLMTLPQQVNSSHCFLPLKTCPDTTALMQGIVTEDLAHWLTEWAIKAENHFHEVKDMIKQYPHRKNLWQPPYLLARLHRTWLRKATKAQWAIFQQTIALTPLRQLWIVCDPRG